MVEKEVNAVYAHMGYNTGAVPQPETLDTKTGTIKVTLPPKRMDKRRGLWGTFKSRFLDVMELADAARVFPRLFMVAYGVMIGQTIMWYRTLEVPSSEQTAFISILAGVFAPMLKWYMETGRDWSLRNEEKE